MEKYYEEWDGKKFPVRTVRLPEELGGFEANVSDIDLQTILLFIRYK